MTDDEKLDRLKRAAEESRLLRQSVVEDLGPQIVGLAGVMSGVIGSGGKILIAANGALAATANAFVADLLVRTAVDRQRHALPALALSTNPAVLTAAADYFGFENIFSRQVDGLGQKGDMLLVLSVDGNCVNLIRAAQAARERNLLSCALLGGNGGDLAKVTDRSLIVPHTSPQRVQEELLFVANSLADLLERDLFA
jgi:D-sedoheptulose 7-phosphate isomerase